MMTTSEFFANTQELINLLLRYVVAGGSAVLVFGALQPDPYKFLRVGTEISLWLLLLIIFVVGPAIYAVHRGLLHPFILCLILLLLKWRLKIDKSIKEIKEHLSEEINRWQADKDPWMVSYKAWAAQIHFSYCSAWGIISAYLVAYLVYKDKMESYLLICMGAAVILFLSAVISDYRLSKRQLKKAFAIK